MKTLLAVVLTVAMGLGVVLIHDMGGEVGDNIVWGT